jgi:hypothetical protein
MSYLAMTPGALITLLGLCAITSSPEDRTAISFIVFFLFGIIPLGVAGAFVFRSLYKKTKEWKVFVSNKIYEFDAYIGKLHSQLSHAREIVSQ